MPYLFFLHWIADSCFESASYTSPEIEKHEKVDNPEACQIKCQEKGGCHFWTYEHSKYKNCYLHDQTAAEPEYDVTPNPPYYCTRGPKFCEGKQTTHNMYCIRIYSIYMEHPV